MSEKLVIKFGADPEFFLQDANSRPVSAHDRVPGTKKEPYKVPGGAIQADGTAVEINIDPASSGDEFATNVERVLKEARKMVDKDLKFVFNSMQEYPGNVWEAIPKPAKEVGCDPDFVASMAGIMWEPAHRSPLIRFGSQCYAGGHLHVGWTKGQNVEGKGHLFDCCAVVFAMDHGVQQVLSKLTSPHWKDTYNPMDRVRAAFGYGANSVMRPKPYGVEYRTPSNSWLRYPDLWPWMYDASSFTINRLQDGDITSTTKIKVKTSYYSDSDTKVEWSNHILHGGNTEYMNQWGKEKWGSGWPEVSSKMLQSRDPI